MQFSQSPHLKNHERTHSGEKPYVCEVCDKGFARHATLWNHRRIHTGEKPYKCSICSSAFSQAAHLKNHAKVHSGEKPHKCDICSAAFGDRFALKRHRGIHEKYGRFFDKRNSIENVLNTNNLQDKLHRKSKRTLMMQWMMQIKAGLCMLWRNKNFKIWMMMHNKKSKSFQGYRISNHIGNTLGRRSSMYILYKRLLHLMFLIMS